jgi:DNA-binding CsgD family transcriptional regulator
MAEVEEVSRLIGDIYDASLDSSLWPSAFAGIQGFLGDCTASLVSQEAVTKAVDLHFMLGHDQAYVDLFLERYFKINPIFPPVMFLDVERTHELADVIPRQEFCQSRFAREWLAPQGICDGVISTVEKSAIGCTAFMTMRRISEGLCNAEFRRRFGLLVPHVRRALLIGNVIDHHKVEAAALADSLDTLASGMFIVNETGRIIHANASGCAMVAEARVLRAPNGRLRASDPATDQALLDVFTAAGGGDAVLGRKGIAVSLKARDGERYVAHVLPLTSGARRKAGISYGAVASIFVRKAAIDLPSPPVALAREFQLTPAELRVLFSIVEAGSVSEVADMLGISEATVRTHLHRLYEKTSTSRQADLVKLVAGYCVAP